MSEKIISESWKNALGQNAVELIKVKYAQITEQRKAQEILPLEGEHSGIFYALNTTPFEDVKVLIIGQDPYPNREDAHGLAFSKKSGKVPASLKNIFEKIKEDVGIENVSGNLTPWAKQGVLMLNRALTFTKNESLAKRNKFWKPVIDSIIESLINRNKPLVVILWGIPANEIAQFSFNNENNLKNHSVYIIRSSHPSNMGNAKNSDIFDGRVKSFMSTPTFSQCNKILKSLGCNEINWQT